MTQESEAAFAAMWQEKAAIVSANLAEISDTLRQTVAGRDRFTSEAMESCVGLLDRGKKLRGVLVLIGSELYREADDDTIAAAAGKAAAALEVCHTHLLVMDDVQDNTDTRRKEETAHRRQSKVIAQHSQAKDAEKRGIDMVQTASLAAHTHAVSALLSLDVAAERSNLAGILLNQRLLSTGIGQLGDLSPVALADITSQNVLRIATEKTAYYTFLLPLEIGAVLAGATLEDLTRFHEYALNTGLAFQLQDDIISTFGDPAVTGKPLMSDIMEGKKTFLMAQALELASEADRETLVSALGNKALRADHFRECTEIITKTGALEAAYQLEARCAERALAALHRDKDPRWPKRQVNFLNDLTLQVISRAA